MLVHDREYVRYLKTGDTTDEATAKSQGFSDLANKCRVELSRFVDGCNSRALHGLIGEIGWPSSDFHPDWAAYNAVGEVCYQVMDAGNLDCTYWAAGDSWNNTYNLQIYRNSPQSQPTSVASVVEAHKSTTPVAVVPVPPAPAPVPPAPAPVPPVLPALAPSAAVTAASVIAIGAPDPWARCVQTLLVRLGYNQGVNGGYGSNTTRNVKTFQQKMGLPVTGKVDGATLFKLLT